jgi:hypothetical protein
MMILLLSVVILCWLMLLTDTACYFVIHFTVKFGTIGRLYYMMLYSAVFVRITSWFPAAYNDMISSDRFA